MVRLLVFSGRPDPEWALDNDGIATLKRHVGEIIGGEHAHAPALGGLGYRGFLIESHDPDISTTMLVFHGVITVEPGAKPEYWRDITGLEEWLFTEAELHEQGDILQALGVRDGGRSGAGPDSL
jgi:hypothetical protein